MYSLGVINIFLRKPLWRMIIINSKENFKKLKKNTQFQFFKFIKIVILEIILRYIKDFKNFKFY